MVGFIGFGVPMRSIWGVVLMASTVAVAQGPQIKTGLWEMTTVRTTSDGPPQTGKGKICIAAGDREKMMHPENPKIPGCGVNVKAEAHGMTFEMTCTGKLTMQSRGSTTIVDAEHVEDEIELKMDVNGVPHRQMDRMSYHFVSAACGAVKPGERPVPE